MSPSRGTHHTTASTGTTHHAAEHATNAEADVRSASALASAKRNLAFLFNPQDASGGRPARLRTRALLRALHYVGVFVFWRLVRYAKIAVVGMAVAALGGGLITGVGWFVAPPTFAASAGVGLMWMVGKAAFRRLRVKERAVKGGEVRLEGVRKDGSFGLDMGPTAEAW